MTQRTEDITSPAHILRARGEKVPVTARAIKKMVESSADMLAGMCNGTCTIIVEYTPPSQTKPIRVEETRGVLKG